MRAAGRLDALTVAAPAQVGGGDVHAVLGKPLRERLADAARGAGDDGEFAVDVPWPCCHSLCGSEYHI